MFRILSTLCIFPIALAAVGCERQATSQTHEARADQAEPIAAGELVSGTLWKRPVASPGEAGSNEGGSPPKGSRVEVYENFNIVTDPDGTSQLSLHGWYTGFRFKRD